MGTLTALLSSSDAMTPQRISRYRASEKARRTSLFENGPTAPSTVIQGPLLPSEWRGASIRGLVVGNGGNPFGCQDCATQYNTIANFQVMPNATYQGPTTGALNRWRPIGVLQDLSGGALPAGGERPAGDP